MPSGPSPTPGIYSNSCPSSRWCHPAISSSVVPFSSCPQSLPASGSFPVRQLFTWGGQSTGVSASALVLPINTQDWSPLGWTGWISLQSKGLSRVFFQHHSSKTSILWHSAFFAVQLSHPYMTTGKTIALTRRTFVGKVKRQELNPFLCSEMSHLWRIPFPVDEVVLCSQDNLALIQQYFFNSLLYVRTSLSISLKIPENEPSHSPLKSSSKMSQWYR